MRLLNMLGLVLFQTAMYGQGFAGVITYKTTILADEGADLDTSILKTDGRISKYSITNGRYKNEYLDENSQVAYSYNYHNGSKRMYDYYADKEYITYRDSRRGNSTNYSTKINRDSSVSMLGYSTFQVTRETNYGQVTTYYAGSLSVDTESFKEHAVGNWYEEIKQVNGALTLRSITKYPNYTSMHEAISVERRDLSEEDFKLPEIPTVANFQSLHSRVQLIPLEEEQIKCFQGYLKKARKLKGRSGDHTTYLQFVVTESGSIRFLKAYNEDTLGLDDLAIELVNSCQLSFRAGMIGNAPVASEVFFPVEFKVD